MKMKRREFLVAGLGLNIASAAIVLAQQGGAAPDRAGRGGGGGAGRGRGGTPTRMEKTTRLFKSPGMFAGYFREPDKTEKSGSVHESLRQS